MQNLSILNQNSKNASLMTLYMIQQNFELYYQIEKSYQETA